MTTEIQIEISMLACAFLLGIFLRLVFCGLEFLRKMIFRGKICGVCVDVFYWVMTACCVYGLMYRYATGTLRGIILLFALSGLTFMTAIDRKIAKKLKKRVKNG